MTKFSLSLARTLKISVVLTVCTNILVKGNAMLQNWEAFPKHPFSHHVVDKLVLLQKLFWNYRLPLAKGYNLSYETSYIKYQTPPQGQNTTAYANSCCTLSQTVTRLSLCSIKDDTVTSTFFVIKLSWEQPNCCEWGE